MWWSEGERAQGSSRIYAFEGYLKSRIIAGSTISVYDGTVSGRPSESVGDVREYVLLVRGRGIVE